MDGWWLFSLQSTDGNILHQLTLGNLVLGDNPTELNLDIPSDARILTDEQGLLLVLTGATDRYPHGVVGDRIEAPSFALMDATLDELSMITVEVESNSVIEGLSPIWADIDEDGEREIIVTVSNHQPGAGLVMSASLRGYTSHRIGSRDLDMAGTVDFDGDGNVELLVADQNNTRLAAIRHTAGGAEEVWSFPLPGRLATNLGVGTTESGKIEVALGLEDGTILIWRVPQ
jgi:hypothetical protein